MTVVPDNREAVWYDIIRLLDFDPDTLPHYWTTVFDKYQLMDLNDKRPFCKDCGSIKVFEFDDKLYCTKEYKIIQEDDGTIKQVKINEYENPHNCVLETPLESIDRMTKEIVDMLEEPTGNKLTLFALESHMLGAQEDDYFETASNGDVTKGFVKQKFYKIKQMMIEDLNEAKKQIRFTSVLRTPPMSTR